MCIYIYTGIYIYKVCIYICMYVYSLLVKPISNQEITAFTQFVPLPLAAAAAKR